VSATLPPPRDVRGRPPGRPDDRPDVIAPASADRPPAEAPAAAIVQRSAREERQRRYAAETERDRRWWLSELEERFDHRHDGLAAARRFDEALALYALLFAGGSKCRVLAELRQAERRLQQARGGAG
jgi:hypothetical protein